MSTVRKKKAKRMEMALHASFEVEAISRHLNRELPMEQPEYQHLRALVVRILSLNSVVLSVLDNDDRATEELHEILEGCQ